MNNPAGSVTRSGRKGLGLVQQEITAIGCNCISTDFSCLLHCSLLFCPQDSIKLSHMYVDNAAMQLIRWPKQFDTILCGNIFGDILSDEVAAIRISRQQY